MSIAEKLTTIAENQQRVYDAGKQAEYDRLVDETKIIEKTVNGSTICVNDVSEISHKCTVSVDKDANVTVCGKNLVNLDAMLNSQLTKDENGIYHMGNKTSGAWNFGIPIPANTPVTFTFLDLKGQNTGKTALLTLSKTFADGSQGPTVWFGTSESFPNKTTIIHNSDFLRFAISAYSPSEDYYCEFSGLQVEIGTTATAYEPYSEPTTHTISAGQTIEVDSICPTMTLFADNDATITFGYHQSWGMVQGKQEAIENLPAGYLKVDPAWTSFSYLCQSRPSIVASLKYSDTANGTTFVSTFQSCEVNSIPSLDLRKGTNLNGMFAYSSSIEEIGEIDISNATAVANMFLSTSGLKRITFVPGCIKLSLSFAQSKLLEDTAIASIIDGLADLTGQTTQTLTFHADVGAKLTDEQKASITAKNWTLAY